MSNKFRKDAYMTDAIKNIESTPEEQERLAGNLTNNNGSLDCKLPSEDRSSIFRSTRLFLLVFLSAWIMQGMFLTYFVSIATTIEKLFQIQSKTIGTLLAATEIGQICTALFLTYFAGRGHRPRWIAYMMLVLTCGIIGCMVPHFIYGTKLLQVHKGTHIRTDELLCATTSSFINNTVSVCKPELAKDPEMTSIIVSCIFVSLLLVGIGQTGISTLGIPYIDDNVGSRESPLYMALTIGIRVIGPASGFLLGYMCVKIYVNPSEKPSYGPEKAEWVGAWWLGMVFIATLIFFLSLLMFCFPRQIKQQSVVEIQKETKEQLKQEQKPILNDFIATIKRQLSNDILMCRIASSVLHLVPMSGLYNFLPKYLEIQYKLQPSEANLVTGLGGILVIGLGIITSGVVILKLVPTARQVAAWTATVAFVYSIGMLTLIYVYCPDEEFANLVYPKEQLRSKEYILNSTTSYGPICNTNCLCADTKFTTICGQDGLTYFSACHAGCQNLTDNIYFNCECIDGKHKFKESNQNLSLLSSNNWGFAVPGNCGTSCQQFYIFLVLFVLIMFTHASSEVGSILLNIRCTRPEDKAMAMGVLQFAIGLFGNVPCSIIYGAVIDAACYFREHICNQPGACLHYDKKLFRTYYLGLTGGLMFLGFIMDILVWKKATRIDLSPSDNQDVTMPKSNTTVMEPLAITPNTDVTI